MNPRLYLIFALILVGVAGVSGAVLLDNGANTTTGWITLDGRTSTTFAADTVFYNSAPGSLKITDSGAGSGLYRREGLYFTQNSTSGSLINATFYVAVSSATNYNEWGLRRKTYPIGTDTNGQDAYVTLYTDSGNFKTFDGPTTNYVLRSITANTWYKVSIVYEMKNATHANDTFDLYINDVLEADDYTYRFNNFGVDMVAFQATGSSSTGSSWIDSIYIADNSTPPSPGNTTYVSLTAIDAYDGSSITTFNATINGTNYPTTNGTIVTDIPDNTTSLYNITFISEDYFSNESLNVNVSSGTYQATMAQAYVSYKCLEKYTNNSLDCAQNGPFPRKLGSYTDTINVTDYYSVSETYNLTSYFNVPVGESTLPRRTLIANYTWDGSWLNPESLILDPNSGSGARTTLTDGTSTFYFNTTSVTGAAAYILAPGGYSGNVNPGCNAQEPFMARVRSVSISTGGSGVYLECYDGSNWDLLGSSSSAAFTTAPLARAIRYNQEYFAVEATDFFDYNLTVQADDYAGNPESDFNITLQNTVLGIAYSDTASGTTITYELLSGYTYATVLNATSTIYGDPVNQIGYANISIVGTPPASESYQFNLSAARPVFVTLYYEENLTLFENPANLSLIPLSDSSEVFITETTSNGTANFYNIPVAEYRLRVSSPGYHDEDRYFILSTYTGQNLTAYFRENTTGTEKEFNVVDERNILQNGWIIRFQRYYNDTGWITVDEARSNIDGLAVENVFSNEYYRLILLNEGLVEEYRSERTLLLQDTYQISSDVDTITNTQINKVLGVSGLVYMYPNLNRVEAIGTSSSGTRDWKLELYRTYTDGPVLINSTTASGDSVNLSLYLPNATGRYYAVLSIMGSEIQTAANSIFIGGGPAAIGSSGAFYSFVLLLGIVGLAVFSAPAAIVLSIFALAVASMTGLFYVGLNAIVGLAIVGGMIIFRRNT